MQDLLQEDFNFWKEAILSLHPIRGLGVIIGSFTLEGHQIWKWRSEDEHDQLLRCNHKDTVDPNRWQCSTEGTQSPLEGMLCSVATLPDNTVKIMGCTAPGQATIAPTSLLQALDVGGLVDVEQPGSNR